MDGPSSPPSNRGTSSAGERQDDGGSLPPEVGTADRLLITGPPMTGKYRLLHRHLAERGDTTLFLSTDRSASRVRSDHADVAGGDRNRLFVVDCSGTGGTGEERTRNAAPGNLTELGVAFTAISDTLVAEAAAPTVGIYSLSHLLPYQNAKRVGRFVRTLSSETVERGWPFAAVLSSTAHDEQARHTLQEPFDCLLETRVTDDDREYRVRGSLDTPTDWYSF